MASHTTLEEKFVEFLEICEAKQTYQNSRPKIQKVAEYLRNRNNYEKHFSPMFVSIGPIHHDNQNLKLGENYKLTCAAKYIQNTQQTPQFLHKKIVDNIDELKGLYADDVLANTAEFLKGFRSLEEKLSWMLFVDGCFLLYIMMHVNGQLDEQYVNVKVDNQLVLVTKDVLLLENQLPYLVLKLLWKNDNGYELIHNMKNFLKCYNWITSTTSRWPGIQDKLSTVDLIEHVVDLPSEPPTHLLDLGRKMILTKSNPKMEASNEANNERKEQTRKFSVNVMKYWTITGLRAMGIKVKSSQTLSPTDVDFSETWFAAELILPEIVVDDDTAASFLNLIAYEMCPDFENDYGICSFVVFMNSLIAYPEDVTELRSRGILLSSLGSDEEVADLFSVISTDLVPKKETYIEVRAKRHQYLYSNKWKILIALSYHTYFSIAAVIALALTFIQTWFTIFPLAS